MSLATRKAVPRDADAIAGVHVRSWLDAYPTLLPPAYLVGRLSEVRQRVAWRRRLQRRNAETVLVAIEGDVRVVGYATFGPCRRQRLVYADEIYELYVDTVDQNRGVGRRLLSDAIARIRRNGNRLPVVEVLAGNPARFFYERMGGHRAGAASRAFAGEQLETVIYAWPDVSDRRAPRWAAP